jgi:hypothetical protein
LCIIVSIIVIRTQGIIFVSESDLDWEPVLKAWLNKKASNIGTIFSTCFAKFVGKCSGPKSYGHLFHFVGRSCRPVMQCSRIGTLYTAIYPLYCYILLYTAIYPLYCYTAILLHTPYFPYYSLLHTDTLTHTNRYDRGLQPIPLSMLHVVCLLIPFSYTYLYYCLLTQ